MERLVLATSRKSSGSSAVHRLYQHYVDVGDADIYLLAPTFFAEKRKIFFFLKHIEIPPHY